MDKKKNTFYLTFVVYHYKSICFKFISTVKTEEENVTQEMIDNAREYVRKIAINSFGYDKDNLSIAFSHASN